MMYRAAPLLASAPARAAAPQRASDAGSRLVCRFGGGAGPYLLYISRELGPSFSYSRRLRWPARVI
eukprot:COSAG02_NODE_56338_length_286_cov_0.582888_1_plen_65_part_10